MSIKIMVDSAWDIGKKEAEELGIIMVPMAITIGTHVGPGAVGFAYFAKQYVLKPY